MAKDIVKLLHDLKVPEILEIKQHKDQLRQEILTRINQKTPDDIKSPSNIFTWQKVAFALSLAAILIFIVIVSLPRDEKAGEFLLQKARVSYSKGTVSISSSGKTLPKQPGFLLPTDVVIETEAGALLDISLPGFIELRFLENTLVTLQEVVSENGRQQSLVTLEAGSLIVVMKQDSARDSFIVAAANFHFAAMETVFMVTMHSEQEVELVVLYGNVEIIYTGEKSPSSPGGLSAGEQIILTPESGSDLQPVRALPQNFPAVWAYLTELAIRYPVMKDSLQKMKGTLLPTPVPTLGGKDDRLVIFCQRAGRFYLGMHLSELRALLGEPDMINPGSEDVEFHQYESEGLAFAIRKKSGVIYSIALQGYSDSGYIFENGCTMDMDYNQMISCFGPPDSSSEAPGKTFYYYDQLCISVEIMNKNDKVIEINLGK